MDTRSKIVTLDQAAEAAARVRAAGRRVVVVTGAFDVVQAAHARLLNRVRDGGHAVVAAVYDDDTLCAVLGRKRPVLGAAARAELVAGLAAVECVVVCGQSELGALYCRLEPDRIENADGCPGERDLIAEVLDPKRQEARSEERE